MLRTLPAEGALAAYLPRLQLARVLARRRRGGSPQQPEDLEAALLLVDLAGFSAATTALSDRGAQGTEELSQAVLPLFAALTEAIHQHGGDVLYYAGDAVAAAFPAGRDLPLEMATLQATSAALACQQVTRDGAPSASFDLRLRASVSCGRARVFEAGGTDGRWLLYVVGPAVDDLARTDQGSVPGRVALSPAAHARIAGRVQAAIHPTGLAFVETVHQPAPPAPPPDLDASDAAAEVERMVPPPIAARLASGVRTPIFEFRQVSVVFMHMTRTTPWSGDQFALAQLGLAAAQQAVVQAGGMVLNVIGDKGLGLISLFGAPSLSKEDDAARALDAALEQHRKLAALGISVAIGVASGRVLCAEHENQVRHGFDAVGSTMVLAARLMQQVGSDGILCCRQTARLAERFGHHAEALPAVSLKGFRQPVAPLRPLGRGATPARGPRAQFGREPELAMLDAAVARLADQADSPSPAPADAFWLEGEAGIGKSTLLQHVQRTADTLGLRAVHGAADAREVNTPYYALRGVLASLAGLDGTEGPGQVRSRVLDWLDHAAPELYDLAPLIDSFLPLELTETEQTALLQGAARAERLVDLVVALFQHETRTTPLLVTIEDLHWSTDEAWDILRQLLERVPRLLIVATLRPLERERTLLSSHGQHVRLRGLDSRGTSALVAAQLGVDKVPEDLGRIVYERSEGNPFFTEEIARSLVEAEAVQVHLGRVDLRTGLDSAALPQTIAGVLTARLDRLSLSTQTILKAASVVGRSFTRPELEAVLAEQALGAQLDEALDELVRLRFLDQEELAGGRWTFRHALVQDTVYSLLPFAHRRPLHRAVAEYLESHHQADRSSVTALLAYHWTQADEPEPAAAYSALAGQQALDAYASDACINHLERALELDTRVRGPLKRDIRRATWARALAEAWYSVPRLDKALEWYEQAWVLAGWAPPRAGLRTVGVLLRHIWLRHFPPQPTRDPELVQRCEQAAASASDVSTIHLWRGAMHHYLHTAFAADNIGRLVDRGHTVGEARSTVGYLVVLLGMHEIGLRDLDRSVELALTSSTGRSAGPLTLRGMAKVMIGQVEASLPSHQQAVQVAERFSAGLWRHRTLFMNAEATLMLGRYDETIALMERVVPIARQAEPSSCGHATAIIGLCHLRQGVSPSEVVASLAGPLGLPMTEGAQVLQRFSTMALLAWARWLAGDGVAALEQVDQAITLAARSGQECFSYLRAIDGHVHLALACFDAVAHGSHAEKEQAARLVPRAVGHVRKQARTFPVLAATRGLVEGYALQVTGKADRSRKPLERGLGAAERMGLAWEEGMICWRLAHATTGPESEEWLTRAAGIAERLGDRRLAADVKHSRATTER